MPSRIQARPTARRRVEAPAGGPATRLEGLDTLRAGTMLLVVAFHAALAYAPTPIPRLIWACRDPQAHPIMDLFCWWSLGISAPFFLMSGFFAAQLHAARGGRAFLIGRGRRIAVPLLVAIPTVLPATLVVWIVGWLATGESSLREVQRLRFHGKGFQENLLGPGHLWSLEYLTLMLLLFWCWEEVARHLPAREGRQVGGWGRRLASPWRPLWAAIPSAMILWAGHRHGGLDVMLDRSNSFIPEPFRFLHYGLFFAIGAALFRANPRLEGHDGRGWTCLALSVPALAARAWLIRGDLVAPLSGAPAAALAATGALSSWLLTFGLLGVALGPAFARPRPAVRYLADSSYWIYLIHLPVVGLAQVALLGVPASATVKFAVVLAATIALGVASYAAIVRHTSLGTWLHGPRGRHQARPFVRPAAPWVLSRGSDDRARPGETGPGPIDHPRPRAIGPRAVVAWTLPACACLAIAAVACGLPAYAARDAAESRALAQVRRLGGSHERDVKVQDDPVIAVLLAGCPVDADGLAALAGLPHLQRLTLRGTPIRDADLDLVGGNADLRVLDLDETRVGDPGLARLAAFPRLRALYLARTGVTDAGLPHLARMTKLLHLGLSGTAIGDAGLGHLRQLTGLRELDLSGTRVTAAGLAALRGALPRTRIIASP